MTDQILALVAAHKWIPLAALVVGFLVRLVKSDTKLPINVPPQLRPWLAYGLGLVAAALDMVVGGASWQDAALVAFISPTLAILGHWFGVDTLRGGREIPLPGLMVPVVPVAPETIKRIKLDESILFLVVLLCSGCAGHFEEARAPRIALGAAAPVRDAALCSSLDSASATWGAVGKGSAALGGVAGLSTIAVEDKSLKTGLAVGAVVLAGTAVGELYLSDRKATSWARECQ